MSLFSRIAGLFTGSTKTETVRPTAPQAKKPAKQVYEGPKFDQPPEFAQGVEASFLVKACEEHAACIFTPKFEQHRLYRPTRDGAGNLQIEFEGVAVKCPPITQFGQAIGREDGQSRAYRYGDINHIYACCCGKPQNCRFFNKMMADRKRLERFQT